MAVPGNSELPEGTQSSRVGIAHVDSQVLEECRPATEPELVPSSWRRDSSNLATVRSERDLLDADAIGVTEMNAIRVIAVTTVLGGIAWNLGCVAPAIGPPVRSGIAVAETCPEESASRPTPDSPQLPQEVAAGVPDGIHRPFVMAAGQKALWCGDITEGYRAVWIHSYRAVRLASLIKTKDGWRADAVEFADPRQLPPTPASLPPATVSSQRDSQPSDAVVKAFLGAVDGAKYWTTPGWRDGGAEDGAIWVIEGRRGPIYRVVSRNNFRDPALEHLIRELFRGAGLSIPEEMLPRSHP